MGYLKNLMDASNAQDICVNATEVHAQDNRGKTMSQRSIYRPMTNLALSQLSRLTPRNLSCRLLSTSCVESTRKHKVRQIKTKEGCRVEQYSKKMYLIVLEKAIMMV